MSILINEEKMVEDNIFKYEEKIKSPTARFVESTPTFVTYYQVNNNETTTDDGFIDVSSIIGRASPIRYKQINKFPLYNIEAIVLQLQDSEIGLDANFESEAVILPGTIKPNPNDFFIIPYLKDAYLFRVTEISYDNVMPDNFYKIGYKLEYIDNEKIGSIDDQVNEKYSCTIENIGTDSKCIIESDDAERLKEIDEMYNDIASTYLTIFYSDRYNCVLGEMGPNLFLYDPLQTDFINNHGLFNKKGMMDIKILSDHYTDNKRKIKYEKSVYRFIERRDIRLVNNFKYSYFTAGSAKDSLFARWYDDTVNILDIPSNLPDNALNIFSDEYVESIKINGFTQSDYADLIQKFVRKEELSLKDIPLTLNNELLKLDANLEVFFFTPIILYIIREIVNEYLKVQK